MTTASEGPHYASESRLAPLAYMKSGLALDDPFQYHRKSRFPGNEDGKLLEYGIRIHHLLASYELYKELTEDECKEFRFLAEEIPKRVLRLPIATGRSGKDNFCREWQVEGKSPYPWKYPTTAERRKYETEGLGYQTYVSLAPDNYFYKNPEGDFYGHFKVEGESVARAIGADEHNYIRSYMYPPNKYMSERS
ncbi:hypothetical protein EXIGLDRAFT_747024 [Exidia glandulosa HHB12029]|uniref:Uncharacterized protein n=1 Tax=Exidia glandulosa HHB12029 TaxID=1314781 RepID=A0A165L8H9_EXIGL|nr:hypothetical protein EXIGLDRAFT_747024 [Exidia glandulosa HHB12029]